MKSCSLALMLCFVLLAVVNSATAQTEVDRRYVVVNGRTFEKRTYNVPPWFAEHCHRELGGDEKRVAQRILERNSVTFDDGAGARFYPNGSLLVVWNTAHGIELTEAYLGVDGCFFGRGFSNVTTIVEVIEMDRSEFLRRQSENPPADNGDTLRRSVQKAVRSGDAKVLETLAVTGRSGLSAVAASFSFEVYPSADNAPIAPEKVKLGGAGTKLADVSAGPTAWECRDVGLRLEVTPTIRDSENDVALSVYLTITGRDEQLDTVWPNEDIPDHERREMPTYDTRKVGTQSIVTHGRYALIAVWKPTDNEERASNDRVQLVFVRADIMVMSR